jgi:hypothetical protein
MSQYPDELGSWWTEFPGSDRAAWLAPSSPAVSALAPAQDGVRGDVSRRDLGRKREGRQSAKKIVQNADSPSRR